MYSFSIIQQPKKWQKSSLGFDAKELSRLSLGQAIAEAESVSVKEQVELIDGRPCYVIEAINIETDPSVHWSYDVRAWIDYQRDYRPLKFEKYRSIPGKNRFKVVSRRVDNIRLEQIDGIWLPIEGTRTTFSTNDIDPPKGMTAARFGALPSEQRLQLGDFRLTPMVPTRKLEIDVESIRLNKGISPEAFTIAFPKGCEVYDEFAGNRYIVGEQSEEDAALSDAELIEQTKKLSVSELIDVLRSKSLGFSKRRWFAVIHRLVEIGPPAVPQLVAEIRKSEQSRTQSRIALTLRAIGDLNAVAGLIDALERAGFSSDYGLGEPKTELDRFYIQYQMDPAKESLGLGRPVREITIALERLTGHSEGHDHFHAYDSAGNRLGGYTVTPEIRDRQRQHRREVAQKWRTWWQANKDKIKPPEMPPTPPAEPKPPKPIKHEGMVLAAPEGAELTLAIVPKIGDSARQPRLTKEQYQKYLDDLAENGPFAGSVRGDSFQWLPIKGDTKNYKGLPLSAYKERTYILLCARAQFVMIPEVEGKRIWGLEAVEVTRDMQSRDAISVRFDEKGAELLAKLTKANIDNHLALAVDGWVRLASVILAPLKEAAIITGEFPAGEVRTLVEDLKKGMPVVDQQAITVMQQIAEAAEKLNKDDLAKMGPRQVVENLLVAGLAGDSEKLAWFVRGESVAAKAITIDDFAQMADGHKIKVLEVHADANDALAVTSNIKGKSGDQEGQLIFYLSKQTGAWLIHDADVGDPQRVQDDIARFKNKHRNAKLDSSSQAVDSSQAAIPAIIERLKSAKYVQSGKGTAMVVSSESTSSYQDTSGTERIVDFRFKGNLSRSDAFTCDKGKRGEFEYSWARGPMSSAQSNGRDGATVQAEPFRQFHRQVGYDFHPETFIRYQHFRLSELLERMAGQPDIVLEVTKEPKDITRIVGESKDETSEGKIIISLINGADGVRLASWESTSRDSAETRSAARRSRLQVNWQKYAGNWYISKVVSEGAGVYDGLRSERRTTVTILDFTPNVEIEDKEFTLDGLGIRPGATVHDSVLDTTYKYAGAKGDSAERLRRMGTAILMYANDYDDKVPDNVDQLKRFLDVDDMKWLSENVRYLGKGRSSNADPEIPLAYDRTMLQADQAEGTNVLFISGIVSFKTRTQLEKLGISIPPSLSWGEAVEGVQVAAIREEGFNQVLDDWGRWKYQLDRVDDTDSAMSIFKMFCDQFDHEQVFDTRDIRAQAIKFICDKLNVNELIEQYVSALHSGRKLQSVLRVPDVVLSTCDATRTEHGGKKVLPASISAVWYALRMIDAKLDARDYDRTNIIEEMVTPALLRRYESKGGSWILLDQAILLGGPAIAEFLLKQDWRSQTADNVEFVCAARINKWLIRLVNLDDPAGRKFRTENRDLVVGLADKWSNHWSRRVLHYARLPRFLFFDKDQGKQSFAWRYWPMYSAKMDAVSNVTNRLRKKYAYLAMLEPLSDTQMYVDCWREAHGSRGDDHLYIDTAMAPVPFQRRVPLAKAILEEVMQRLNKLGTRTKENRDEHDQLDATKSKLNRLLKNEAPTIGGAKANKRAEVETPDKVSSLAWGEAVEGLQVRLRTDKTAWRMGETPTFSLDLRNNGKKIFPYVRVMEAHCQIEYDGQWYSWPYPASVHFPDGVLHENHQFNDVLIPLDERLGVNVTPGQHVVRVAFFPEPWNPTSRVVSKPVEIEILPDQLTKSIGVANELPRPMFGTGPRKITSGPDVEPPSRERYQRQGTNNVARVKAVTSSDDEPVTGNLRMIVNDDRYYTWGVGSCVELGPFLQSITIDLQLAHEIEAIVVRHLFEGEDKPRVYYDVIVQVADDADFTRNVRTLFNNDDDNSAGLGKGKDRNYIESKFGKAIHAKGVHARYVRLYSNGNNIDDLNHYTEVEVFGKSLTLRLHESGKSNAQVQAEFGNVARQLMDRWNPPGLRRSSNIMRSANGKYVVFSEGMDKISHSSGSIHYGENLAFVSADGTILWDKQIMYGQPVAVSNQGQVAVTLWRMRENDADSGSNLTPGYKDTMELVLFDANGRPKETGVFPSPVNGSIYMGKFDSSGKVLYFLRHAPSQMSRLYCIESTGRKRWEVQTFFGWELSVAEDGSEVAVIDSAGGEDHKKKFVILNSEGEKILNGRMHHNARLVYRDSRWLAEQPYRPKAEIERKAGTFEGPFKLNEEMTIKMSPVLPVPGISIHPLSIRFDKPGSKIRARVSVVGENSEHNYKSYVQVETLLEDGRVYARRKALVPVRNTGDAPTILEFFLSASHPDEKLPRFRLTVKTMELIDVPAVTEGDFTLGKKLNVGLKAAESSHDDADYLKVNSIKFVASDDRSWDTGLNAFLSGEQCTVNGSKWLVKVELLDSNGRVIVWALRKFTRRTSCTGHMGPVSLGPTENATGAERFRITIQRAAKDAVDSVDQPFVPNHVRYVELVDDIIGELNPIVNIRTLKFELLDDSQLQVTLNALVAHIAETKWLIHIELLDADNNIVKELKTILATRVDKRPEYRMESTPSYFKEQAVISLGRLSEISNVARFRVGMRAAQKDDTATEQANWREVVEGVQVEVERLQRPTDSQNNQAEPQRNTDEVKYEGRTIAEWIAQWDTRVSDDIDAASNALIKIGRPAVPRMVEEVKKRSNHGWHAVGVLAKMGPAAEDAIELLIEAALDKDLRFGDGRQSTTAYRGSVLSSLSRMTWARDRVIPVLQRIAEDGEEDTGVRRQVILALRGVGKGAMPILQKLTEVEERSVRDAAHGVLAELLGKEEELSKADYYTELIEKDPFDPSVLQYIGNAKGIVNYGRPHPLTQRIKQLYRKRLAKEPDAELAWRLASIIQNGLKNTELIWAAPMDGSKGHWLREDPTENYTTLAEVLELGFRHAQADSELWNKFGIALAKLRLLQGDWDRMNAMLKELGQEPIPTESRQWLSAPPVDWENNLNDQWRAADMPMCLGNCSLEFKIEKDGKGLKGVHFLVKRAPEPTNVFSTGIRADTLFFAPYPPVGRSFGSFGYKGKDRSMTRYAVSDESGVVRFDGLPNIPIKIEVLVPTSNFEEVGSNWDLWMEVEPGKFKIAKIYGGADAVGRGKPPPVEE